MTIQDLSNDVLADAIFKLMTIRSVVDGMCQIGSLRETGRLTLTLADLLSEAQRRNLTREVNANSYTLSNDLDN